MPAKAEYTLSSLTLPVENALEALILKTKQKFLKRYNKQTKDLSSSLFPPIWQSKILLVGKNPPKHIVKEQR